MDHLNQFLQGARLKVFNSYYCLDDLGGVAHLADDSFELPELPFQLTAELEFFPENL